VYPIAADRLLSIFGILPRVVQVIWPPRENGFPAVMPPCVHPIAADRLLPISGILPGRDAGCLAAIVTGFPAIDAAMYGPDNRVWFAPDF